MACYDGRFRNSTDQCACMFEVLKEYESLHENENEKKAELLFKKGLN